ncbi:hypothetical protein J4Q44_G00364120 [Coregonus suidteri]|uniref:Integrin beta n=1 Tax=Coregonus suidteri TaxID=861788 RepID=A0AAN8QAV2_9TELE
MAVTQLHVTKLGLADHDGDFKEDTFTYVASEINHADKMDLKLLLKSVLLGVICYSSAQQEGNECIKANAKSCGEFLKQGEATSTRCDELESLRKRGCSAAKVENPGGSQLVLKNKAVTNRNKGAGNLRPDDITQKLTLSVRSGEPQSFNLKFKRAEDYPIDLYYLMDLSYSMKDNLENVKNLGTQLMLEMSKITSDFRIGEIEKQPGCMRCNEGRIGRQCECSTNEVTSEDLDKNCRKDNGTDICSNNGDCVCGTCECKKRENPEERYSGKFCECDNFNCDRSNNKLCGVQFRPLLHCNRHYTINGHGRCECRVCICDANWTGSACDCSLDTTTCLASNKQICNGRGTCECGTCKECVQCRAFGTGEKKDTCERDCSYFNLIKVKDRDKLPQPGQAFPLMHCKERDANDCWFYYTYAVNKTEKEVHVVETLDCPAGPDIIPIVAGVVAGIVLIGLTLLLIWKLRSHSPPSGDI